MKIVDRKDYETNEEVKTRILKKEYNLQIKTKLRRSNETREDIRAKLNVSLMDLLIILENGFYGLF